MFSIAIISLCGCGKSTMDTTYTAQSEKIQKYIDSQLENNPGYKVVYDNGVARLILKEGEGEGDGLAPGGTVSFRYAGYVFNNGSISAASLFATNDREIAEKSKWTITDESLFEPVEIRLGGDDIVEGLKIGLTGVKAGEECYVLFNGKKGFGKRQSGTIPANAAIAYHLDITDVKK